MAGDQKQQGDKPQHGDKPQGNQQQGGQQQGAQAQDSSTDKSQDIRREETRREETRREDNRREDARREYVSVPPFVVECGDFKSSGMITIDTPPIHTRLRGRWDRANIVGEGSLINRMPSIIPGVQLQVNPRDSKVTIYDPLTDNEEMRQDIQSAHDNDNDVTIRDASGYRVKPTPTVTYDLDQHELKTLLIEIAKKCLRRTDKTDEQIDKRSLFVVSGEVPPVEVAERLPGEELYDPWNNNPRKPRFKRDAEQYERALDRGSELVK